ncbi:glycoside hydrolase family 65 [Aquibacillus salsiterrae]|uniref:Glycoside hydrolase family 65 n=1 Tax=Aquibacillus salsiterrae TaxID=2950439 RepID=A0A9X3WC01_9BACI|nr:glycoside hydrolase family 65 [Aquibacillus salsiterrae]MDC3416008.1 glycoside hydrolase family 65 [Aquibacillus salsiterrae]
MIDRKGVVSRHYPRMTAVNPLSPLTVGNGEFAFTADITGLQTFPEAYQVPLGTQAHWGWHFTGRYDQYSLDDIAFQQLDTYGREVGYPLYPEKQEEAYHWLRQNPHRVQLGQLSFQLLSSSGEEVQIEEIKNINQVLNLWEGVLYSEFAVEDIPVSVTTVCHPATDQVSVKVNSPLIPQGRLKVVLRFPSPDMTDRRWEESIFLNWANREGLKSLLGVNKENSALIKRQIDEDSYQVKWEWNQGNIQQTNTHEFTLFPEQQENLTFSVGFGTQSSKLHSFDESYSTSKEHWSSFWQSGGAIDFSGSSDSRANELERRVVLSQFVTAIHSGGSTPPQETGLIYNSWFGKFHLEMHWWHGAHFPIWGREAILAKSLTWYNAILPRAKEVADSQGYSGARWPKMVGVEGAQTPSPIAPALIWQQPHPIALAELCYQASKADDDLDKWKEMVFETADFMADYAVWDESRAAYVLGPPLIPAQECHRPEDSINPPYELEYWKYGLETAMLWKERLNETVPTIWKDVAEKLAKPPHQNGVYLAHENCPDTFETYNHDHPSMVGALGILPGKMIDFQIMKQTLDRVWQDWQWDTGWGWDFPMCAMTAARLGEGSMAVDFLLMDKTKNTYLPNGHNYQHASLTAYLPGNGGLLTAVAMMACGWNGLADEHAPGFPKDGTWIVKYEGLHPIL